MKRDGAIKLLQLIEEHLGSLSPKDRAAKEKAFWDKIRWINKKVREDQKMNPDAFVVMDEDELDILLHHCNECGVLVPTYNPLCFSCQRKQDAREEDERLSDPNEGCWSYSW